LIAFSAASLDGELGVEVEVDVAGALSGSGGGTGSGRGTLGGMSALGAVVDQSPQRGLWVSDTTPASSCNMAIALVVSKFCGCITSLMDLISGRRPSVKCMMKYIGSVLEE